MKKFMPKWLNLLLIIMLAVVNVPISAAASGVQADQIVNVEKSVNPLSMVEGEETEVTLNVKGSNPVNYVKPNDIILIIDRSGSMMPSKSNNNEDRIGNAKAAAKGFVNLVDFTKHQIGIVDFSTTLTSKPMTTNAGDLNKYVDQITAGGGTATADAIESARGLLHNHRPDAQPVIILLTDGEATHPQPVENARKAALEQAKLAKQEGIVFYTVALLLPDEDPTKSAPNLLMKEMATTAQHHHFVLGSNGLNQIYQDIVKEIGLASAYDVTVTDSVAPEFEIVPGSYENNIPQPTVKGNTLEWKFLELKNEVLTFKYKIRHIKGSKVGDLSVGSEKIKVNYKDHVGTQQAFEVEHPHVNVTYPAPVITTVVQDNGDVAGGQKVEISGKNFRPQPTVLFGDKEAASVEYVSSEKLVVVTPAGVQGEVTLTVKNDDGQQATAKFRYHAQPVIAEIVPNKGPVSGGNEVVIKGDYFMNGAVIKFGDNSATTNSVTQKEIKVKAPASAKSGAVTVEVTNPDGTKVNMPNGYTYVEGPKITSITPNVGSTLGGEKVTITGSQFEQGIKLFLKNKEVPVEFISATELSFVTPAWSVAESVDVKIVNPDLQEVVMANGYKYEYPAPIIESISPAEGPTEGNTLVNVKGNHFREGAKLYFDDKQISIVTVVDSNSIRLRTPQWAKGSLVSLKVVNPDGKEAVKKDAYQYVAPPAPELLTVTPDKGYTSGSEVVTLTGKNFVSGLKVLFNDTSVVISSVKSDSITIKTPKWAKEETVDVTVVNADGQSSTLKQAFTYIAPPPPPGPKIESISPASGPISGGNIVYINGENFKEGYKLYLGSKQITATAFLSDKQLRIRVPEMNTPGKVDVKVVNPDGQFGLLSEGYELLLPPAPTVAKVSPDSGLISGGTIVTVTGTNFSSNNKLTFGDKPLTFTFVSNTELRIKTPAWSKAESVGITVSDVYNQEAKLDGAFTYKEPEKDPAPTIDSISPNEGYLAGGKASFVNGKGFKDGAKVSVGGKDAVTVFVSSEQLKVLMPSWAQEEVVDIKVKNPDGQSGELLKAFSYVTPPPPPKPEITSVTPDKGSMKGEQIVAVNGTNFVEGAKVSLGGKNVITVFVSDTQLRIRTIAWVKPESVDVTVTNPDGQNATLTAGYSFELPPPPAIANITPDSTVYNSSTVITINGENFDSGSQVYFNDVAAITTFISETQLKVRTPQWTKPESVDIKVVTGIGQEGNLPNGFTFIPVPPKPAPVITELKGTSGSASGGHIFYISGANFVNGTTVYFGGVKAITVFVDSTSLKVRTPSSPVKGPVDVKAVNPDGQEGVVVGGYTYN
ncbi:IPT/TIG domain-containing protein [Paenibacillus alvei]|uniref:IPT/TIG domain-containing protein n=1 Tax=Paenibacillus alvei TaxID=44250 RepID=UPI0018CF57AC|nr:IPT/TIG domain-containing protein [Paenibacillus alvei]MCY9579906.1 IPT/TIG domain-containing protein [Paenibacillus alvei]MCY9584083.1 IPT/TIG domain-containing protein [Paenibacillus alvei]